MSRLIDGDALVDALMTYTWHDEDERTIDDADEKREYIKQWMPDLPTVNVLTPRILDLDELQSCLHVWYEVSNGTKPIPGLVIPSRTVTRRRIVAYQPVFDVVVYLPENDCYKRTWRCWSAEPTEEQRKAAKWDG